MPRDYKRVLGSRKYVDYTPEKLQECLNAVRSKQLTQRQAAAQFNIPRRTIINKLKGGEIKKHGHPLTFSEEEENQFVKCILTFSEYGFPLDMFDLRMVVKSYLSRIGRIIPHFKNNVPGRDWAISFIHRHKKLSARFASNIKRSRAGINEEVLREYVKNLGDTCAGVPAENCWNFDETNLTDNPGQKKVLCKRGMKYPERICNTSKSSISLMFCGNAAGEVLPPYVVYKAQNLWNTWTENGPPGCRYNVSQNGWFDTTCFQDWFETILLPRLKKQNGKKVVVCDNLSSHFSVEVLRLCEENNISFVCLPANSTHITQPLDVAFFRPMKAAWRNILTNWKSTPEGGRSLSLDKSCFPRLLKKLMEDIHVNEGKNLVSGFKACGITPVDVEPLLKKIPGLNNSQANIEEIDASFLESLSAKRCEVTKPKFVKKKKLEVIPGKSVGPEILEKSSSRTSVESREVEEMTADVRASTSGVVVKKHKPRKVYSKHPLPFFKKCKGKNHVYSSEDEDDGLSSLLHEAEELEQDIETEKSIMDIATGQKSVAEALSLKKVQKKVGEFVVFVYEDEFFPGKILEFNDDSVKISAFQKALKMWKWPQKEDIHTYAWEDVVGHIDEPKLVSKRGLYSVPELDKVWMF
jgi:hypothetical protein